MGDRCYVTLLIGGEVPSVLKDDLVSAIEAEGPESSYDIDRCMGRKPLELFFDEVNYGELYDLMPFLREHGIEYDYLSGPGVNYGPQAEHYRKGIGYTEYMRTMEGHHIVIRDSLFDVRDLLARGEIDKARRCLDEILGPDVPPLEPLVFSEPRNEDMP